MFGAFFITQFQCSVVKVIEIGPIQPKKRVWFWIVSIAWAVDNCALFVAALQPS